MIRVRFAERGDESAIVDFLRDHWSATHIFVERPEVFVWQHQQAEGDGLNMIMAEDVTPEATTVLGVLGFIPTGRFDATLGTQDVLLAIWKVRDGGPPGLGLRLLKQLDRDLSTRLIGAIGISDVVKPIYKLLRYEVGTMTHSAVFNPNRTDFQIATGVPASAQQSPASVDSDLELEPITSENASEHRDAIEALAADQVPRKSHAYLVERYLNHPWYRYELCLVSDAGRPVAVLIWRRVEAAASHVLRIVDIVGDVEWLSRAHGHFQQLVVASGAEYIDLVQSGVAQELLDAGGFSTIGDVPDLVLPNHFAPFERRTIPIDFAYKVTETTKPVRLFRADSDQDRPNRPEELTAR